MSDRWEPERRHGNGAMGRAARKSPASLLILMVVGVVAVSAAASVLFGSGYGDETPHGKVLGTLQRVAGAEEAYHATTGRFTGELSALRLEPADSVDLVVTGDADSWEAVARHPVGLSCVQSGRVSGRRVVREEPGCYTGP